MTVFLITHVNYFFIFLNRSIIYGVKCPDFKSSQMSFQIYMSMQIHTYQHIEYFYHSRKLPGVLIQASSCPPSHSLHLMPRQPLSWILSLQISFICFKLHIKGITRLCLCSFSHCSSCCSCNCTYINFFDFSLLYEIVLLCLLCRWENEGKPSSDPSKVSQLTRRSEVWTQKPRF